MSNLYDPKRRVTVVNNVQLPAGSGVNDVEIDKSDDDFQVVRGNDGNGVVVRKYSGVVTAAVTVQVHSKAHELLHDLYLGQIQAEAVPALYPFSYAELGSGYKIQASRCVFTRQPTRSFADGAPTATFNIALVNGVIETVGRNTVVTG